MRVRARPRNKASAGANASVAGGGLARVAIAPVLILGQELPNFPRESNIASLGMGGKVMSLDSGSGLIEALDQIDAYSGKRLHI